MFITTKLDVICSPPKWPKSLRNNCPNNLVLLFLSLTTCGSVPRKIIPPPSYCHHTTIIMKTILFLFAFGFWALSAAPKKPNIVLIMADDMGYSDIGCYGSEIKTQNVGPVQNPFYHSTLDKFLLVFGNGKMTGGDAKFFVSHKKGACSLLGWCQPRHSRNTPQGRSPSGGMKLTVRTKIGRKTPLKKVREI